jgi:hypothetical protein
MKFDPHSVSASPIHLSPVRRGEEAPVARLGPFLAPTDVGERWPAKRDGVGDL